MNILPLEVYVESAKAVPEAVDSTVRRTGSGISTGSTSSMVDSIVFRSVSGVCTGSFSARGRHYCQ